MARVQLRGIVSPADRAAVMGLRRGPGPDQYLNSMEQIFAEADQEQRALPRPGAGHAGRERPRPRPRGARLTRGSPRSPSPASAYADHAPPGAELARIGRSLSVSSPGQATATCRLFAVVQSAGCRLWPAPETAS